MNFLLAHRLKLNGKEKNEKKINDHIKSTAVEATTTTTKKQWAVTTIEIIIIVVKVVAEAVAL